ncbi:MAG TPA: Crp/Fnr family transcriptional regulator [Bacillota bacterium]|nr:Crp/Fnr family transcriptional regulator [Bacillota bacterium]HOK68159.1 Crp/Fnr family transcriptional regulator [Bacillota bacterium]HPP86160.1 Crp/Fnr family transcriptional regulator [Bacillota bacterium]
MANEGIERCRKSFPFWEKLTNEERELLERNVSVVKYSKGENIHSGGTSCKGIMIIKSGSLRTYLLSEGGREVTLYRLYNGDVCVLSASCVLDYITFDVFVDAEEDSEVVIIGASAFQAVMNSNIYVECYAYKMIAESFSNVMWAVQQILFMSFDRRLANFLYEEMKKTGSDTVSLTHEQVAKYMGSAREVVTRMLKYFVNEGIVELSRGGIKIIDMHKLKRLL